MPIDAQSGALPDQYPTVRTGYEVAGTVPGTQWASPMAAPLCSRKRMVFGVSNSSF